MAFTSMEFSPMDGLKNSEAYETTPLSEEAARAQVQDVSDQLRDHINNTLAAELENTVTGFSGAERIGSAPINQVSGMTVREQIVDLKEQLTQAVTDGFGSGDVTSEMIAAEAVTGEKIADNAIGSEHLTDGCVGNAHLSADCVAGEQIVNGAVQGSHIDNNAVSESHISSGAVSETKLGSGAVTETKIGTGAVTENKIGAGAVTTYKIGAGAVTTNRIDNYAVTSSKLGDDSVTQAKIADNAVGVSQITEGAVGSSQLGNNAVNSNHIVDGAVGTNELATDAVTQVKIADNAVGAAQIAANAVGTSEIVNNSVTAAKIVDGSSSGLDADKLDGVHLDQIDTNVAITNGTHIPCPRGGLYSNSSGGTGFLTVRLPTYAKDSYADVFFWLDIFDAAGKSTSIWVSGYLWFGSSSWHSPRAGRVGGPGFDVCFGYDSSYLYVGIGEATTPWSRCIARVRDVLVGFNNTEISRWDDTWNVDIRTSIGTIQTIVATA